MRSATDAAAPAAGNARPVTRLALALVALAGLVALVPGSAGSQAAVQLAPCTLASGVDALCGAFRVPEDRSAADGRTLALRIAVLPARDGGTSADPLVYVAGGPGGSAVADAAWVDAVFRSLNESRDIVLVDQRGTGGSSPLVCPPPARGLKPVPTAVRAYLKSCLERFDADPRQYGTATAMDDLAEVVRALGYAEINLYGGSYGGTAVQYFLAQHPELVRTVILDGATGLNVPIFELWGRNGDRAVRTILARCADSPRCARAYPRARSELFEAIARLRRAPVRLQGTVIDAAAAAGAIQSLSRTPFGAARIPWIAHEARTGNWAPLAITIEQQADDAATTRRVMFWSMVCNEPWARWDPVRTAAASRGTYLAERTALDARRAAMVCAAFPTTAQPQWASAPVRSDRPALVLVGGADPQDPLANVAAALSELPNGRAVVVPAGGHGTLQLGCVRELARRFVEQGSVAGLDTRCAGAYAPPPFVLPVR
jgi:pimeloyl-ACP methyl ester carboxylesterase